MQRRRLQECTPPIDLPRLKQATVQPMEPKREPQAWEDYRNPLHHQSDAGFRKIPKSHACWPWSLPT